MMQQLGPWIVPLTFIPGVGLIIMSTSARFSALSVEMRKLKAEKLSNSSIIFKTQMRRARLFSNALVSLYLAVGNFATGALIGGLSERFPELSHWVLVVTICLGVFCMLYASIQLLRESIITRQLIEIQCQE